MNPKPVLLSAIYQTVLFETMNYSSDQDLAAILVEMTDSQPTLSPLKRGHDSEDEIPSSQPAPKRSKTTELRHYTEPHR